MLDLVVNGRRVSARGPTPDRLVTGPPVDRIEEEVGSAVLWRRPEDPVPAVLRILTDDGSVLFDRLAYAGCEDAPAVALPPKAVSRPAGPRTGQAPAATRDRPRPALPQGAIP